VEDGLTYTFVQIDTSFNHFFYPSLYVHMTTNWIPRKENLSAAQHPEKIVRDAISFARPNRLHVITKRLTVLVRRFCYRWFVSAQL